MVVAPELKGRLARIERDLTILIFDQWLFGVCNHFIQGCGTFVQFDIVQVEVQSFGADIDTVER